MAWWWWYYNYYGGYYYNAQETQRLQNQNKASQREHDYKLKQLADKRAKEEAVERQRMKDKEREIMVQKEKAAKAKRDFEAKMKQMKVKEKEDAMKSVKADIKVYENKKAQADKELVRLEKEYQIQHSELKKLQNKMKVFKEDRDRDLKAAQRLVDLAEEKFNDADRKIRDAIKTTDVDEGNIPQFLNLINDGLLFATMRGQIESDKMLSKLKVFTTLMERTCAAKLSIDAYFTDQSLNRFIPILAAQDMVFMDDIKCVDKEEWDEFKEMMDEGLKTEEKKKDQKMKVKEKNALKRLTMKPEKTWLDDQNAKQEIVRKSLMKSAPKLSHFFGVMHTTIDEIDKLLAIDSSLNETQRKAIQDAPKVTIEEVDNDDDKEEKEKEEKEQNPMNRMAMDDYQERQNLDTGSECLIYAKSLNKWCHGTIVEVEFCSDGQYLNVKYGDDDKSMVKVQRYAEEIKPIGGDRKSWDKGTKVEIYSNSEAAWFQGMIVNIKNDKEGEWLEVEYSVDDKINRKDIGRWSPQLKEATMDKEELQLIKANQEYKQSKDITKTEYKEDHLNDTNKQCNALSTVALHKLHVVEGLENEFSVDEKEIDLLEKEINKELEPKQKKLEKLVEQMDEIEAELAMIETEMDEIDEEKEELEEEDDEDEDEDEDDDDDSDDDDDDDKKDKSGKKEQLKELKEQKKELKKKRKKHRLKQKKLAITLNKLKGNIQVIKSRRGELKSTQDILQEAFTVANNVQGSCLQIIQSQCVTRQSILLARELLKYKPAIPRAEAEPLWTAITNGIGDIFENALKLSQISSEFFAFFMKFKHSFHHFVSANKLKEDVSLLVALEYLRTDVRDIQKFQAKVDDKVDKLRESAIATIKNCVVNTAGAKEFDTAISSKQDAEESWRKAEESYNSLKGTKDNAFQLLFADSEVIISQIKSIEFEKSEQNKHITINSDWIKSLKEQLKKLNELQVTK